MEHRITDDLEKLKAALPAYLVDSLEQIGRSDNLVEVILDLGRVPTARYNDGGEVVLDQGEITHDDLQYVVNKIDSFDADNRAGIERTLHRISAIRNRRGDIVGLTCRIGRAVYGTIDIIQDIIEAGRNVLILGAPGVGKTTLLREAARVLAEKKRVVIVDTSNEIGGDGDVPHPAVGRSRRMQVAQPMLQHEVMIEAVENHNPEVIVIDEIGRELEAAAARTIAERGVQLIGTAHGQTLDNLMLNPTLSDLVGGIESVTLSDEEARRRGTQKVVLERRSPPTFDVLVELQDRHRLVLHEDIAEAVDARLRGRPLPVEVRYRTADGQVVVEKMNPTTDLTERNTGRRTQGLSAQSSNGGNGNGNGNGNGYRRDEGQGREKDQRAGRGVQRDYGREYAGSSGAALTRRQNQPLHVYAYGVSRDRLMLAARRLRVPVIVEDNFPDAQVILTLKNYYRRRPKLIVDAERKGMTIEVLRANTATQMEDFLARVFNVGQDETGDE
ncbi:MAG: AAA family ATPase [Anaerolineae bacterium]